MNDLSTLIAMAAAMGGSTQLKRRAPKQPKDKKYRKEKPAERRARQQAKAAK